MVQPSDIREHMTVLGSDGGRVGRVDHVVGDEIELTKWDLTAGLRHHMIPLSWVDSVDDHGVRLNRTKDVARREWRLKH
jgi:hypothetical protein